MRLESVVINRWKKPYAWLSIASITIIALSAIVILGFLHWYAATTSLISGFTASAITELQMVYAQISIPVLTSITGAILLFKPDKWRYGTYLTFGAVGAFVIMDAIYISSWWDGQHVIYSKTQAAWISTLATGLLEYSQTTIAFYAVYMPLLLATILFLSIGFKKLK